MRILTQLKPIINRTNEVKIPPKNTLLIGLTEVGNDELIEYVDNTGLNGNYVYYIPNKLFRYNSSKYITGIRKNKNAKRFIISSGFLKSKRSAVIDMSYYMNLLYKRGMKLSTSKKLLQIFKKLIGNIINLGGDKYSNKYIWYIVDTSSLDFNMNRGTFKKSRLGLLFYILSDPKLKAWFDENIGRIFVSIVSPNKNVLNLVLYDKDMIQEDDDKFDPSSYFTRLISIIKKMSNEKEIDEKVNNKINKMLDTVDETPELKDKKEEVKKLLNDFGEKYPDEIEAIDDKDIINKKVIKKVVAKAVKSYNDKSIDVSTKEIDTLVEDLVKIKIPKITIPEKMTENDIISTSKPIEPDVGNVTEYSRKSFEDKFEDYVKLFNYHFNRKGYQIISVEKLDNVTEDIADTELDNYMIKIKTPKDKVYDIKFYLPKLIDGKFFVYKGVKRVFTNQLYPLPVSSFRPHESIIRTNFADITVTLETKFKKKTFFTKVLGKKIPAILIFIAYYGNLKTMVDKFKIKFTVSDKKDKDAHISVKFSKGYVNLYSDKPEIKLLLNGLGVYRFELEDDTQEEWLKKISSKTSSKFASNLDNYFEQFIDPMTLYILKTEKLPTEFDDLLWYSCLESFSGKTIRQTDLRHRRIRSSEILAVMLFKRIYYAIFEYEQSQKMSGGQSSKTLKIPIDALINDLTLTDAQSQYQRVGSLNPLVDANYATRLSYSGYGGVKSDFVPMNLRNIDPTYFGQICPVDTPESQSAGAVQHFTTNAEILNMAGKLKIKVPQNDMNIFSVAVSLSPFATSNDPARNLMMASQQRHAIPLKNAEKPLVMSGYENIPSLLSSSDFSIKAKMGGTVISVDDHYVTVKYSNGEIETYSLKPKGGDVNASLEYRILVSEGDKLKKNQLIAENKYFFDKGYYKYGINLYTVIMPYNGWNYEDGIILSESAAKKLMVSEHIGEKVIRINSDYRIDSLITDTGNVPKSTPIVKLNVRSPDILNDIDDEQSQEDLIIDNSVYFILPYDIDIVDIEIYASDKQILDVFPEVKELIENQTKRYKNLIKKYQELGLDTSNINKRIKLLASPYGKRYKGEKLKNEIIIIYKYRYDRPTVIGDKFANRHGNKGVVGRIMPDSLMPRDPDGKPFDIIMNPLGIPSRKNPGQLLELFYTSASRHAGKELKMIFEQKDLKAAKEYLINFYKAVYNYKNEIKKTMVDNINNLSKKELLELIEEYIKYGVYIYSPPTLGLNIKDVMYLYKHLGIKMKDYVYLPEFKSKSLEKVAFGYIYWIKQEQLVETKMAARSTGTYRSKVLQPTSGKASGGGQRMGELDVWSLASYGAMNTIKELSTIMSDEFESKNALISSIIKKGNASLEKIKPTEPESARILKVYLAGLMISEDLSFTETEY